MINLTDVNVVFNQNSAFEAYALKDITLNIPSEQSVTIIGSNGAGKSTLLNVISGAIFPTTGKIFIENKDVSSLPIYKRAKFVSRVFQDSMLGSCPNLSVEENFALAYSRGKSRTLRWAIRPNLRKLFREQLATLNLGLENKLKEPIGLLSGGQRQAVNLLIAVLSHTKILVLDEHTAALDPKTADSIMQLTEKIIRQKKLTTLMITHSLRQALRTEGRIIMMHMGQIIFDISNKERKNLEIKDLLGLFQESSKLSLDSDTLLFN